MKAKPEERIAAFDESHGFNVHPETLSVRENTRTGRICEAKP
jgi:hypothetical protein